MVEYRVAQHLQRIGDSLERETPRGSMAARGADVCD
jgi:hypothetical protein